MDTDVLIVGAGPTGLMLANQLARRGIRAQIIDRHRGPARETRALGVQARTLEIYAGLGIVERALALGKRATGANLWADGKHTGRVPLSEAGQMATPYPFILILGQDDNERLMGERLLAFGMPIRWNTELVALEQTANQVNATLRQPDGTTSAVSAQWIAGCDGAHSAVRELSGIAFEGAPYEHVFFVADTDVTGSMVPDEVNVYLWKSGFHLFFPMRGNDHWRIVGILPDDLRERHDVEFDDVIPSLRAEAGTTLAFRKCTWFSTYRIHHRRAARFRDGRAFLLGDAAHIHSPMGAQGMNTGLQDSYNLAWKLALVIARQADPALLDTYEAERIPVAERLLETTDRAFRLVVSKGKLAGLLRTRVIANVMASAMRRPRIARMAFRVVSQIGIAYPASPLSKALAEPAHGAPRAGDRFPWLRLRFKPEEPVRDLFDMLDPVRFNLLAFGTSTAEVDAIGLADLVRVHIVPIDDINAGELARARIAQPSFYLLRPDGHVGLCGGILAATDVVSYLRENVKLPNVESAVAASSALPRAIHLRR
jgi:2-polyprenyl-6-methoxyphenol hydroxylase-like FAD-dependent oxidoreductase